MVRVALLRDFARSWFDLRDIYTIAKLFLNRILERVTNRDALV